MLWLGTETQTAQIDEDNTCEDTAKTAHKRTAPVPQAVYTPGTQEHPEA